MKNRNAIGLILVWLLITMAALFAMATRDVSNEKPIGKLASSTKVAEVIYYTGGIN